MVDIWKVRCVENCVEIRIPQHPKITEGIGWKLRCVASGLAIRIPPKGICWKLRYAWERSGNHNSKTPQNPPGNWLKAPLCGKRSGNQNSKIQQNPRGNWLQAPMWMETVWKSQFQTTTKSQNPIPTPEFQNTTISPQELFESSVAIPKQSNGQLDDPSRGSDTWTPMATDDDADDDDDDDDDGDHDDDDEDSIRSSFSEVCHATADLPTAVRLSTLRWPYHISSHTHRHRTHQRP